MSHILFQLTHLPPLGVYIFVLVWMAAESAGLPLPNEAVLLTLGFLAHRGSLSLPPLIICAVVGSGIGATISYQIGYALGRPLVGRVAARLRISPERLERAESWVRRRGGTGVFLTRVIPVARNLASYAAGMASIRPPVFYPAMLLGSLVWCATVTTAGDLIGAHYRTVIRYGARAGLVALGVAVVAALLWLAAGWLRRRRASG